MKRFIDYFSHHSLNQLTHLVSKVKVELAAYEEFCVIAFYALVEYYSRDLCDTGTAEFVSCPSHSVCVEQQVLEIDGKGECL